MKGMCKRCKDRDTCRVLCKKAEEYVNQDYVSIEEGLVDIFIENYDRYDLFGNDIWITPNFDNPTILKAAILLLYKDGKTTREIEKLVPCSRRYIRQIVGSK